MNAPIPLGHARMWRNLSLEQVARLTGATVADILAVELGDGTHLSPGTDVAALLRAYANAVGLDPEAVVRNHLPSLSSDRGHSDHALHPVASNHRDAQSSTNGRTSACLHPVPSTGQLTGTFESDAALPWQLYRIQALRDVFGAVTPPP